MPGLRSVKNFQEFPRISKKKWSCPKFANATSVMMCCTAPTKLHQSKMQIGTDSIEFQPNRKFNWNSATQMALFSCINTVIWLTHRKYTWAPISANELEEICKLHVQFAWLFPEELLSEAITRPGQAVNMQIRCLPISDNPIITFYALNFNWINSGDLSISTVNWDYWPQPSIKC